MNLRFALPTSWPGRPQATHTRSSPSRAGALTTRKWILASFATLLTCASAAQAFSPVISCEALGSIGLPWKIAFIPSLDVQSGFPYSNVDALQNYVGAPNSLRFPTYFTFDFSVYREFHPPVFKSHLVRLGIFSLNSTNRRNPTAVYNDTASPYFGDFTGLGKRVNGFVLDIVK